MAGLVALGARRPPAGQGWGKQKAAATGGGVAYRDLREFVKKLEKSGELRRVKAEVDPILEITEVTQRVARDAARAKDSVGPALLFERPKDSKIPVLVNTFGS